jgi:hypothetical protein
MEGLARQIKMLGAAAPEAPFVGMHHADAVEMERLSHYPKGIAIGTEGVLGEGDGSTVVSAERYKSWSTKAYTAHRLAFPLRGDFVPRADIDSNAGFASMATLLGMSDTEMGSMMDLIMGAAASDDKTMFPLMMSPKLTSEITAVKNFTSNSATHVKESRNTHTFFIGAPGVNGNFDIDGCWVVDPDKKSSEVRFHCFRGTMNSAGKGMYRYGFVTSDTDKKTGNLSFKLDSTGEATSQFDVMRSVAHEETHVLFKATAWGGPPKKK